MQGQQPFIGEKIIYSGIVSPESELKSPECHEMLLASIQEPFKRYDGEECENEYKQITRNKEALRAFSQ